MPLSNLEESMNRLYWLVRAGHPLIVIGTYEESRALDYIGRMMRVLNQPGRPMKRLLRWTVGSGLEIAAEGGLTPIEKAKTWLETEGPGAFTWTKRGSDSPEQALHAIAEADIAGDPQVYDSL